MHCILEGCDLLHSQQFELIINWFLAFLFLTGLIYLVLNVI